MKPILALLLLVVSQSLAQTAAPDRFKQFDQNADGKLTREEFPAPKIFDGADADKDGIVTAEELAAYQQRTQPIPKPPAKTESPAKT